MRVGWKHIVGALLLVIGVPWTVGGLYLTVGQLAPVVADPSKLSGPAGGEYFGAIEMMIMVTTPGALLTCLGIWGVQMPTQLR